VSPVFLYKTFAMLKIVLAGVVLSFGAKIVTEDWPQ
jgi:hypothetical protein